ncbi:GDP-L-fucose synthase family protein [Desulforhabdus amnigena]|uniref:GDP-L-fucose synthase n=1 Tax=Desulforhabdus amnigena TaxID=40218 RepID=A0A9W6LAT5_9BACT|nr:GDP-L-fucose synthase [Desulforhabdus amnigena]GLI36464.1 GDP-L-fucose synthase [Desulforhabdus amnigena]
MNRTEKIFVAGAAGMVGSALVRALVAQGFENIVGSIHRSRPPLDAGTGERMRLVPLDLLDQQAVKGFYTRERPAHVFLAAARVGGIHANNTYPASFIYENLVIQSNIIHGAYECGVSRLLFLGSSCIYPKLAPQPMREEHLLTGPLEPTNEPYALAKIAGIKTCESYNRQYGTRFVAVMPTNLYGPGDNFHPQNSHVLPALLRRFHEARQNRAERVTVWGTGKAMREFLHVDDMAEASLFVMNLPDDALQRELLSYPRPCFVNVGTGQDVTIRELAETVANTVGYKGELIFDASKPDGTPRKLLDVSRLTALGWTARIGLEEGIRSTYAWFLKNEAQARLG